MLVLAVLLRPPVSGGKVTSWFGIRVAFGRVLHPGTDIALPTGAPVNSTSWGTVKEIGFHERYGNYIVISHLPVIDSRYMHLDSMRVSIGAEVNPQTIIGTVGNTGLSTGSHLHFEIRLLGIPLPPYLLCFPGRIAQRLGVYRFVDSMMAGSTAN